MHRKTRPLQLSNKSVYHAYIRLKVKHVNDFHTFTLSQFDIVANLTAIWQQIIDVPFEKIMFIYCAKRLQGHQTLVDCNIGEGSIVYAVTLG